MNKKQQEEIYKREGIIGKITLDALDLAKSHSNWKTDKGSMTSFSRAKNKFVKVLKDNLQEWFEKTCV